MKNRRTFIKQTTALAAGSILLPYCSSPKKEESSSRNTTVEKTKRNIGVQLYTVRDQMDQDLEGTLAKIAEIGYKEVEIAGYADGQYYKRTPAEFRKILDDNGLKAISAHYRTGRVLTEQGGTLSKDFDQAIEDMATMGQTHAALGWLHEDERSLDDYKRLVDMLNVAGEKCKAAGIQFCYHNHDFEFWDVEGTIPMYYILDNTDPETLQMELDLYWINKVNLDHVEFFGKYANRVPLWHIKDMDANGDFTEVGNGSVNFKSAFDNEELAGMKHFFVEQDQSDNPIQSITKSFGYVSENLI